jgi:hypothetical protein
MKMEATCFVDKFMCLLNQDLPVHRHDSHTQCGTSWLLMNQEEEEKEAGSVLQTMLEGQLSRHIA